MQVPHVFSSSNNVKEAPLLIMNVELANQRVEPLVFLPSDDLVLKVQEFCLRFGLSADLAAILLENARQNLNLSQNHGENDLGCDLMEERPRSLADIYKGQKEAHSGAIFFESRAQKLPDFSSPEPSKPKETSSSKAVFNRLYSSSTKNLKRKAAEDDKKRFSSEKKKNQIETVEKVTDRLYKQSLGVRSAKQLNFMGKRSIFKEAFRRKFEEIRNERSNLREIECTHRPALNPISELIVENKRLTETRPIEFSLMAWGKNTVLNKDLKRYKSLRTELEKCTFQPKITNSSSNLQSQMSVFEKLHSTKNKKQSLLSNEQNTPQKQLSSGKKRGEFRDFLARQEAFALRKKDQEEKLAARDLNVDPETGTQFFHPQTLKTSPYSHSGSSPNRFETLYSQKDRRGMLVRYMLEKENVELQMHSFKPLDISHRIIETKRRSVLAQIFKLLDSDGDGEITAEDMDISQIDSKKLRILAPFFCWMEGNGIKLSSDAFINESNKFVRILDLHALHELFDSS